MHNGFNYKMMPLTVTTASGNQEMFDYQLSIRIFDRFRWASLYRFSCQDLLQVFEVRGYVLSAQGAAKLMTTITYQLKSKSTPLSGRFQRYIILK